jgi:hypothetical protein
MWGVCPSNLAMAKGVRGSRESSRGFELQRRSPNAMPLRRGTLRAEEAWLVASSIASEMLSCRRGDGGRYDKKQEGAVSITVGNNDYARLGAVGLYLYCLLLARLAVLFSAAFATFPYWLWPAS